MLAQGTTATALEKSVIAGFNSKLADRVAWLKGNNTGVRRPPAVLFMAQMLTSSAARQVSTWIWDSNTDFTTILNAPTKYGFVDATSYGNTGDFWGCACFIFTLISCRLTCFFPSTFRNNYHPSSTLRFFG